MKTPYIIHIPIYDDCIRVVFGKKDDVIQALKNECVIPECIINEFFNNINVNTINGVYWYNEITQYHLIWMPEVPEKVKHYATLVHELQHFVFKFLDLRGFQHTDASDEAYSYLLGFVYSEIDYIISNLREKEKKYE